MSAPRKPLRSAMVSVSLILSLCAAAQAQSQAADETLNGTVLAPVGFNFWTTIRASQPLDLPADFFGPDTEPFKEDVVFIGKPLESPIGDADTIMYREEPVVVGKTIHTRLVAFYNVSAAPIEIKGGGDRAGFYDIHVGLSREKASTGTLTITSVEGSSGTMRGTITVYPRFEFRPLEGGESIFVDTGERELPGFPLELTSERGTWTTDKSLVPEHPAPFLSGDFFYTSIINIEYVVDGVLVGDCAKRNARAL